VIDDEDLVENKWSRDSMVLGGIVAALVVAFIAISLVYIKGIVDRSAENKARDEFISCVRKWSDAYTRRADLLQDLSTARTDALDARTRAEDKFLRHLLADPQHFRRELLTLLYADQTYLDASDAYRAASRNNPVPASPQFACSHGKQGVAPARIAGLSSTPAAPRAGTSTSPSTRPGRPVPTSAAEAPPQPTNANRPDRTTVTSTKHATATVRPTATRTVTGTPTRPPSPSSTSSPAPRPNPIRSVVCGLLVPLCPGPT
jgi:hypothetical protein